MNTVNPTVSVWVSAYNHEEYIEQAIMSIVNQTYQDFELLVIDDGSSDKTPEILEKLSQQYGFFFEKQENQGLPRTLNKLVRMAKGEYITGCASDDFWPEPRLEEQIQFFNSNPEAKIVHGMVEYVDKSGHSSGAKLHFSQLADGCKSYYNLLLRRKRYQTGTLMVHREVFETVGYYDEDIEVEDRDFITRATRCFNLHARPSVWSYHRKHGKNWTAVRSGIEKIIRSNLLTMKKLPALDGLLFLYGFTPYWFLMSWKHKLPHRLVFFLVFPLFLFNLKYYRVLARVLVGEQGLKYLNRKRL